MNTVVINKIRTELLKALEDQTDSAEFERKSSQVNELLGWQTYVRYYASETSLVSLYREYRTGEPAGAQSNQANQPAQLTLF